MKVPCTILLVQGHYVQVISERRLTGNSASSDGINPSNIAAAWNAGELIVLATGSNPQSSEIVAGHAYAVVGNNASSTLPFLVYNPWGTTAWGTPQGDPFVYGLFYANAAFLSQNFTGQYIGTGAAAGLDDQGDGSQEVGVLRIGLDQTGLHPPPATHKPPGSPLSTQPAQFCGFAPASGASFNTCNCA
jgi:hypothetical protein